ncbi:tetratricopeptide repeat protein [Limobrevibacterium gyesilva]|uniref:Tetratricopeptide repeat protein n=1 Tax=Limobrevibacterium gyesilva TaxID=2991712 RepID=A0AA42CF25_9PROT|nr:tetratricopeptide repeat protein [Limobrevibacterium gyesilva]MCW3476014.1 tetratricopeptide repeat protein [Limobrevibacterium gyesilva]
MSHAESLAEPDAAPTLVDRLVAALAAHRAGRIAEAGAGYRGVLDDDPAQPVALHLLGVLTLATGRAAEAVELLRRAMVERSNNEETRLALANALAALGRHDEAIGLYRALLADRPGNHAAMVNLANALRDAGHAKEAIAICRQALATSPRLVPAHVTLGSAMLAAGQVVPAIGAYRTAVTLQPDFAPAQIGFALALLRDNRVIDALAAASRAVELQPGLAEAWFVRGAVERAMRRFEPAVASLRRAIAADPGHARAHLTLGNALLDRDDAAAAETHLRAAVALAPELPEAHASLGFLLAGAGRLDEAVAACDAAIRLRPEFAHAHWNRGCAHLLAGDFAPGWEDFEWRKRHDAFGHDFPALPGREWDGGPLEGRRLLVRAEQGLGDAIQFARYLPLLAAQGAVVLLACAPPLIALLQTLPGVAAVVAKDAALPPYDLWVDQMSLPRLIGTRLDSVPAPQGYLAAAPERIAAWEPMRPHRPLVGLVWAGNPAHANDARRSMPTEALAPIVAVPGIDWMNLQIGGRGVELAIRHRLPTPPPGLTDLAETAALVTTLDLVIAVDTAVAHLAGALGKPVWIMLPFAPDWRWMTGRSDSPWYASARLFRQDRPGDWAGVTARVATALTGRYGPRSGADPLIP